MRILFLDPCAQLGGAERCLLDVMASLRRVQPDWQLHLITGEDGPLLADARLCDVTAEALPFPPEIARLGSFGSNPVALAWNCLSVLPSLNQYQRALGARIRGIGPDLIHSNGLKMHLLGAWLGSAAESAPVIWHLHDFVSSRPAIAHALAFAVSRISAHRPNRLSAIAVSERVAHDALQTFHHRIPIATVLNGVDLNRFQPAGPQLDLDRLAGMSQAEPGTVRVGLVATFARWKGHEVFLRALAHPDLSHVRAYIIGGPIYRTAQSQYSANELKEMAEQLGLRNRVGFTGFIKDSAAAMRSLDIVVHASTEPEPFGLSIAEAMACGRAVIVANAGRESEIFRHFHDALGTTPGDVESLAQAIAYLANDRATRMRLGENARATATACFDSNRVGRALAAIYQETLEPCACSTSIAEIFTAA